jgi:hypothetical protein
MFLLAEALYMEGHVFLLFTSLLFLCSRRSYFFLLVLPFSSQPQPFHPLMPIKKVAHIATMVKKGGNKMALKWVSSTFEESDLTKAKKDGFLPEAAVIIFPGDERVPSPPEGYRVMFLSFLLYISLLSFSSCLDCFRRA